jgi:hypothetical protein
VTFTEPRGSFASWLNDQTDLGIRCDVLDGLEKVVSLLGYKKTSEKLGNFVAACDVLRFYGAAYAWGGAVSNLKSRGVASVCTLTVELGSAALFSLNFFTDSAWSFKGGTFLNFFADAIDFRTKLNDLRTTRIVCDLSGKVVNDPRTQKDLHQNLQYLKLKLVKIALSLFTGLLTCWAIFTGRSGSFSEFIGDYFEYWRCSVS